MPTKTTTDTSNQYNANSMNTYNGFQGSISNLYNAFVNNPLSNSFFKNQLAQSYGNINQMTSRNNSNVLSNLRTGGGVLSGSGGLTSALLNRSNIQGMNLQQGAFQNTLNSALNNRMTALAGMSAYQPLQTGQTSTQSQSGVGTWLTPIAGAAMNMLMPGIGSMLGGQGFSAGYRPQGGGMSMPSGGNSLPAPNYFNMNSNQNMPRFGYNQ